MKYVAVILIGNNTFLKFEMENHDDPERHVEADAVELAKRLGGRFMYINRVQA